MEGRVVRLRPANSKNSHSRVLAREGELLALMKRRLGAREYKIDKRTTAISVFVFHKKGAKAGDIRKSWDMARKGAKLPNALFHDLRRSGIRNLVRAGVPETVAMQISGHRTRSVFDRYNVTSEKDLREAILKTDAYLARQPKRRRLVTPGDVQGA
jgi:integrase